MAYAEVISCIVVVISFLTNILRIMKSTRMDLEDFNKTKKYMDLLTRVVTVGSLLVYGELIGSFSLIVEAICYIVIYLSETHQLYQLSKLEKSE